jgi:hypothetical protein
VSRQLFFAVLLFIVTSLNPSLLSGQTTSCPGPDWHTDYMLQDLRRVVTADSVQRAARHLPAVPDTAVQLVTSDSLCGRAVAAFRSMAVGLVGDSLPTYLAIARLHVFRVGNAFVVDNPQARLGEWRAMNVFDGTWNHLGTYAR